MHIKLLSESLKRTDHFQELCNRIKCLKDVDSAQPTKDRVLVGLF
jgi:hypothetical protein